MILTFLRIILPIKLLHRKTDIRGRTENVSGRLNYSGRLSAYTGIYYITSVAMEI